MSTPHTCLATLAIGIATLTMLLSQPAGAQTDWLKKGRNCSHGDAEPCRDHHRHQPGCRRAEGSPPGRQRHRSQTTRPTRRFQCRPRHSHPAAEKLHHGTVGSQAPRHVLLLDDLELKLNRAAEQATPKAKELFLSSIEQMTMDDVMGIYNGPPDAATRYFQGKMSNHWVYQ